jgi:alpha-glucosidase
MKIYIYLLVVLCFLSPYSYSGNVTGNCISYSKEGRNVTFHLNDSSAVQLQLCSPSVVRVWFSPDGKLQRGTPSFAVINEELEPFRWTSRMPVMRCSRPNSASG